jgi:hypothetical protein
MAVFRIGLPSIWLRIDVASTNGLLTPAPADDLRRREEIGGANSTDTVADYTD